jgi:hypothetical protein
MSKITEAKAVAELGLMAADLGLMAIKKGAPEAALASKALVDEALQHIFKKPLALTDALPRINEVLAGRSRQAGEVIDHLPTIIESVAKSDQLATLKITKMLGSGAHELVLSAESKGALKLGVDNLPRPIAHKLFDAPVLAHGKLENGVRYYIQPIGETSGVTDKHVVSVVGKIRANGFIEEDMWGFSGTRKDQVALFGKAQKPLLIDQGGAVPRYGMTYRNGELVPHDVQQSNLAEIREFLNDRHIPLIKHSITRPQNPLQMDGNSLSTRMEDWQLSDAVKDYMKMTDRTPTMWGSWTDNEVILALRSLTLGK